MIGSQTLGAPTMDGRQPDIIVGNEDDIVNVHIGKSAIHRVFHDDNLSAPP